MNTTDKLKQEKSQLLRQITEAAKEGSTDKILAASRRLEKIELLISQYEQLDSATNEFLNNKSKSESLEMTIKRTNRIRDIVNPGKKSAKTRGKDIREAYLKKLTERGISLQQIKGNTIYRSKSGEKIGIAVATERQSDRWFLGLPIGGFDDAILLCQPNNGELKDIPLPKAFFNKYDNLMSKSKGQVKFNVVRRGDVYFVQIPGRDEISSIDLRDDSFLR